MEEVEEGWGDVDIDEVVLTSQWSTAVPLGAAAWVQTHSEAKTMTRADTTAGAHVISNDANDVEFTVQEHRQIDKKKKDEEDTASLRHCLGQLLFHLDTTSTTITTTTGSSSGSFSSFSRPLAQRGTSPIATTAAAAPPPPPPPSFGFVEEAVALELIEVMSRFCSSSSSSLHSGNENEEEGGSGEERAGEEEEDVLQYMVWSRCLPPSLPSSSSSSTSSLRQQQQEQQQSERFFLMLCQLLGRKDVPVPLFVLFCNRAVLPRLIRLKVREGGREGESGRKRTRCTERAGA